MTNLVFSYLDAHLIHGEARHAQTVMSELGITYSRSIPCSMSETWTFYGCKNIPDVLPPFIRVKEESK